MAKTNPIGVRFDLDLWEEFNKKEINTAQKILNFLETFFIENRALVSDLKVKSATIVKGNDKPVAKFEIEIPETKPEIYTSPLNQFAAYKAEFWAARDYWQLLDSVKEMRNDSILSRKQKAELEQIATQVQKDKAF